MASEVKTEKYKRCGNIVDTVDGSWGSRARDDEYAQAFATELNRLALRAERLEAALKDVIQEGCECLFSEYDQQRTCLGTCAFGIAKRALSTEAGS